MAVIAHYLTPEGELEHNLDETNVKLAYESGQGLLWVDIGDTTKTDGEYLKRVFGFHHLAIEDCVNPDIHTPKIDDFSKYLFIIVHGINYAVESELVETMELAIFLGTNFVVTNHNHPMLSIDEVLRRVEDDGRPMKRGADFLAHSLIDVIVDNVLPTIDRMDEVTLQIEDEVVHRPQQSTMEAILKLKRSIQRINRVMGPQREVINRLSRGEFKVIGSESQIFYRNVYDHIVRVHDLNQNLRDTADGLLATYLSSVANRQNETMKVLSIVATIFLPLTLLAGIYGMNFEYMPELGWRWAYFVVIVVIIMSIVIAVYFFWAKNWITLGRRKMLPKSLFSVDRKKLAGHEGFSERKNGPRP